MCESPTRRRTAPEPYKSLTWMEWTSYQLLFPKPMRGPEMQFTYTGTTIGMATPTGGAPGKWVDFFWCHFLVHRLLWVTIACLSFIHMCTMRQNLGEYHIKIDLSRRFFERYTKEGNFISGCSKFPGGLMRMEDWGQKFYSCCRFPIIYIKKQFII